MRCCYSIKDLGAEGDVHFSFLLRRFFRDNSFKLKRIGLAFLDLFIVLLDKLYVGVFCQGGITIVADILLWHEGRFRDIL